MRGLYVERADGSSNFFFASAEKTIHEYMFESISDDIGKISDRWNFSLIYDKAKSTFVPGYVWPSKMKDLSSLKVLALLLKPGLAKSFYDSGSHGGPRAYPKGQWYASAGAVLGVYIRRDVLNAEDIIAWAKSIGYQTTLPAEDMHVTIAYSKQAFDPGPLQTQQLTIMPGRQDRAREMLGAAHVLLFASDVLQRRWQEFRDAGASWDYPEYHPHITLTYAGGEASGPVYSGPIVLGPEIREEINPDWKDTVVEKKPKMENEKNKTCKILKIDPEQQLAYGWISITEQGGEPVTDHQGDIIETAELVKMAHKFNTDVRIGKAMHDGEPVAELVESMVFTPDVQKALGIDLGLVGWWGVFKVNDPEVWKRVKSGELSAFSIGGTGNRIDA